MARSSRFRHGRRVREAAAPEYARAPKELTGVLYDTDVVIEILRRRRPILDAAIQLEASGVPTYCTPVSYAEVYAGIRPAEDGPTQAFFGARGEVVLDGAVGQHAGGYLARYARSHGIELADALVAAAASVSGLSLWTLNRKHYPMQDVTFFGR
jgi:predicted nucleic acid-binding protein